MTSQPSTELPNAIQGQRSTAVLTAVVVGLSTAVVMWGTGFITHLPILRDVPALSVVTGLLLLVLQSCGMTIAGYIAPAQKTVLTGFASGTWIAAINLMVLGAVLSEPPSIETGSAVKPNAFIYTAGFFAFSCALGIACSILGAKARAARGYSPFVISHDRLVSVLAITATLGIAPVLLTGGLVTSTESGLAVPDWPNSYAANMFLYPLSKMTGGAYFEHTHRLFGALAGFGVLTLFGVSLIRLLVSKKRMQPSVRHLQRTLLSAGALIAVSIQGSLGGLRVITADGAESPDQWQEQAEATILAGKEVPTNFAITTDNSTSITLAALHGISGQLTLVLVAVVAALFSRRWFETVTRCTTGSAALKPITSLLFVTATIQLAIGALARHHTHEHALYMHAVLAIAVLVLALFAGFGLQRIHRDHNEPLLGRLGSCLVVIVAAQFVLGWIAFIVVVPHWGETVAEEPAASVLIATSHQALGAALLCVSALAALWSYKLIEAQPTGSDAVPLSET